ncbi:4084_t:CDS:2 [Ambispora leptoticha]|uniref:4084_t:CDS:1 n=1 Tax=Ambispora leptoticha TaxID=144679 RepID=A0A9N9GIU1_9GLOM|nr:4084_t:CDS:2 [Ambispora leptoticha]
MLLFSTFAIFLSCVAVVSAHTTIVYPLPRGHPLNPNAAVKDYTCITAPLTPSGNCSTGKPFPCGGYPKDTNITQVFYAGDIISVKFWTSSVPNGPQPGSESTDQARHNGGLCEFSLSYDGGKTYTVIATYHQTCPDIFFDWKVKIPDAAPSCDNPGNCIFSWSWINANGNREFYQNCADIKLIGNSTRPLPIIDITRANLPPLFTNNVTPPGDPANTGNFKGSGPSSYDISANLALNIGGIDPDLLSRDGSNAVLIGKKIYYIGGRTNSQKVKTYLLDLSSDFMVTNPNFTQVFGLENMASPAWTAACLEKEDNSIYIFGGRDASQSALPKLNTMYKIKPSNDTFLDWTAASSQNQGNTWPSARDGIMPVINNQSRIFVWGGLNEGQDNKTMYVFASNNWISYIFDNAPNPRASYSATLLDDGRIIYIGGISRNPYPDVNFLELLIFDTTKLEWNIQLSKSDEQLRNRAFHSALLHSDSISIIMYGGLYEPIEDEIPSDDSVWILNTNSWTWSQQSIPSLPYMNVTRNHTAVMYNGYMIIAFGVYGNNSYTPEVKVMDVSNLSSLSWVPVYKARTSDSSSTPTNDEGDKKIKFIIIGCSIGGGFVIVALVIFFIVMRKHKSDSSATQNGRISKYSEHSNNEPVPADINSTGFPTQIQNPRHSNNEPVSDDISIGLPTGFPTQIQNPDISTGFSTQVQPPPILRYDPLYQQYVPMYPSSYQHNPNSLYPSHQYNPNLIYQFNPNNQN